MKKRKSEDMTCYKVDIDSLLDAIIEETKKDCPGELVDLDSMWDTLYLPVPSLAVRYLLKQEGWPLSRMAMIVGAYESCKTSFACEIGRWHNLSNGAIIWLDTEHKLSVTLMSSILQMYNINEFNKIFKLHRCNTLEEWCKACNMWVTKLREAHDEGYYVPFAIVIDSLTASLSAKIDDVMEREGPQLQRYAVEAKALTDYFKFIPKKITNYPISLICINHLKEHRNEFGAIIRQLPGGYAPKFHESIEIECKRRSSQNPDSKTNISYVEKGKVIEGIELTLSTYKNSYAPHASIDVRFLWYLDYNEELGTQVQYTWFDWDYATTNLLVEHYSRRTPTGKFLDSIGFGFKKERPRVWCKELGITEESPVTFVEFGQHLETCLANNPEFKTKLYTHLGIRSCKMYQPGQSFYHQLYQNVKDTDTNDS